MNTTHAPLRRIADFLRGRPARPNAGGTWPDYRAILGNFLVPRGEAAAVDTPAAWEGVLMTPGLPESWSRRDPVFVDDPFRGLFRERVPYRPRSKPHALSAPRSTPRSAKSRAALAGAANRATLVEDLWRETAARLSLWEDFAARLPVLWSSSAASKFPKQVPFFAKNSLIGFNWAVHAPMVTAEAWRRSAASRKIETALKGMPPMLPPSDPAHAASDDFFLSLIEGDWSWRLCAKLGLSVPQLHQFASHSARIDLAGTSFADLPNPFDPALAILNEGFAWAYDRVEFGGSALRNERDAVILVAPEF